MTTVRDVKKLMQGEEFDGLPDVVAMGDDAVEALKRIVRNAREPAWMRQRAMIVLTEMAATSALRTIQSQLGSDNPVVRLAAARAIAGLKGPEAASDLVPLLEDADPGVCKVAMQCLGDIGAEDAMAPLERARDAAPHPELAQEASRMIERIRKRRIG